ncbi:hypothetical protein ElyMa_004110900 [Elysia marginata]|uniref:Secreted protein n=1 Tax=Elysia marginata TaxID=1093978 RepID=A0AAV4GCI6_9GAST|nr:hypothetical protein ElyMa_004110900 [Elysia marginata]
MDISFCLAAFLCLVVSCQGSVVIVDQRASPAGGVLDKKYDAGLNPDSTLKLLASIQQMITEAADGLENSIAFLENRIEDRMRVIEDKIMFVENRIGDKLDELENRLEDKIDHNNSPNSPVQIDAKNSHTATDLAQTCTRAKQDIIIDSLKDLTQRSDEAQINALGNFSEIVDKK